MQNTTTLNNSDRILLLPKDYSRVWNGEDLYSEMYHADGRRDIQMYQNLAERSVGNIVISHIDQCDAMPFGDKDALIKEIHETLDDNQGLIEVECGTNREDTNTSIPSSRLIIGKSRPQFTVCVCI